MTAVTLNSRQPDFAGLDFSGLSSGQEDKKFFSILAVLVAVYLLVAVVVPFIERIEVPREVKEQVPPQLTRLILEKKQLPKPEPKVVKPEAKPKEEPKPKEQVKPEPKKSVEKAKPKAPVNKQQAAKQKAQSSGLAAMKDELLAMREVLTIAPNANTTLNKGKAEQTKVKRKLLTAKVNQQSKALANAKVSKTVASDELSTRNTQRIRLAEQEVLASGDGSEQYADANTLDRMRSEASIRQTLEASKARLYALYNRALRKEPLLKGKVVFNIEIQPSGAISQVSIDSSELNHAKLERRLLMILKSINFGAEDVEVMTTAWAIEFLPR